MLPLGQEGVIDSPLPRALPAPIYARAGDGPAAVMLAIAFLLVVRRRMHIGRKKI
jgi:apolipoprotein N-acyltransferase